jgi:MFS family permease
VAHLFWVRVFLTPMPHLTVPLPALELVDSKRRNMGNSIICFAFTIGHILLGAAAWVSPSWQFMLQIMYAPGLLVTVLLWFIPESVRWLISKNKITEAQEILKNIAKINGSELTEETLKSIPYIEQTDKAEENDKIPLMAILRKKSLLIRIIHCSFTWICCNFPYYGLTIQSVALSQDIYVNYMCVSVVEIPAYILAYGALDRIGRKKTLALSLILTGVACISVDFIRPGSYCNISRWQHLRFVLQEVRWHSWSSSPENYSSQCLT